MRSAVIRFAVLALLFVPSVCPAADETPSEKKSSSFLEDLLTLPPNAVSGAGTLLNDQIFNLGIIRVGSGRLDEGEDDPFATDVPRSITTVGARELRETEGVPLAEHLAHKEGVTFSDDLGQGMGARIDLRGFGGEAKQALVLFDGVRAVEPFDNSTTWPLYPAEFMERVDITRGGASPVYGEGALSGVISLRTKSPTEKPHVLAEGALGSFNSERYFTEASGTYNGVGAYVGARYFTSEGYRQNGGQEGASTLLKISGRPLEFLKAGNAFYFSENDTGIAGPLLPNEETADRRQKDPDGQFGDGFHDRVIQNGITMRYEIEPLGLEVANLLGYRLRDQDSSQSFGGAFPGRAINQIGTETFSDVLQVSGQIERGNWKSRTTVGVEWEHDDIHNPFTFDDFTFGPFSSNRSIDRRMWGLFAQNESVWDERWTLETGVRWDKIKWDLYDLVSPNLEKHKKADQLSPHIGLNWKVADPVSVFVSHSQAFKAPDSNTLIFETPNLFSPTPDIDSSIAYHNEIGVRYAHPVFGSVRTALFEVDTKKEILFNDISNRNENFDTTRQGVEFGWELAPKEGIELFGNFAWTRARFDNGAFDEKVIPLVPEYKWSAGATWEFWNPFALTIEGNGAADQYALNDFNNRFPMESYATVDAKLTWKRKNVEAWFRAQNLFGEEYSSFASSDGVSVLNLSPSPEQVFEAGVRIEI